MGAFKDDYQHIPMEGLYGFIGTFCMASDGRCMTYFYISSLRSLRFGGWRGPFPAGLVLTVCTP